MSPERGTPSFRGRRPTPLTFGTSGLRGLVTDITDLEAYVNTTGFLGYLSGTGEAQRGDTVCIAGDRRPSTEGPNRSIMRAVARAIEDAGLRVENLGRIPTPALAYYAFQNARVSVMVTGSHIPFSRNGIKFNKRSGEVLKRDEKGILEAVAVARRVEYERPSAASIFADDGMFKPSEVRSLPAASNSAEQAYLNRYTDFFGPSALSGTRVVFFQHSAVGRDLLVELLGSLGAEVVVTGRCETFVAIDTEDISPERLSELQTMADAEARRLGHADAFLSTDGDSDRPLVCGIARDGVLRYHGGDLLGIVVASFLGADSISVPISTNDAVDLYFGQRGVKPLKTKIGSPYVIASMLEARAAGARHVVGWEANGGFLLGSAVERAGRILEPLPTRDAALPLLAVLAQSVERACTVEALFAQLPRRFSRAGLLDAFPQEAGQALVEHFAAADEAARAELGTYFDSQEGFGRITAINTLDGIRIRFENGDVAHFRPSGNAPQLRIYACADSQARADEIVALAVREPDGLLRKLARDVARA